jgi:hypothetical protein
MSASKNSFMDMRQQDLKENNESIPMYTEAPKETGLTLTASKFLDLDKQAIKDLAMSVVDEYQDGFKSPAEGLLLSKKLEELAIQIKENLKDAAANELKLAKGEKANVHGANSNRTDDRGSLRFFKL